MLCYLSAEALAAYPRLKETMFTDRARQFRDRLGWEVRVNRDGWETDQYDPLNPLYVIWRNPDGTHGGSMRFLPTTGRTMVNEHFLHLSPAGPVRNHGIWECTRL